MMPESYALRAALAVMIMVFAVPGCVRNGVKPGEENAGQAHPAPSEAATERDGPPAAPQFPFSAEEAEAYQQAYAGYRAVPVERENSIGMRLALIPPGTYQRGSPEEEAGRIEWERQHPVNLTRGFYMATTTVTQGHWREVMGSTLLEHAAQHIDLTKHNRRERIAAETEDHPMRYVNWHEAIEFCRRLTERERRAGRIGPNERYRLPTEAEWEYACRAGTATAYHSGDTEADLARVGWYRGNSDLGAGRLPQPVGRKQPNAWGLYDMHGNVYEWCQDWFGEYPDGMVTDSAGPQSGRVRVLRGCDWTMIGAGCRSASRNPASPTAFSAPIFGFRIVLEGAVAKPPNGNATVEPRDE